MRTSKYVNKRFGRWICTDIGISHVQGKRAKYPGHMSYYYIFERVTSDGACEKIIRLNCNEAAKVYHGIMSVEEILDRREAKPIKKPSRKINYRFLK